MKIVIDGIVQGVGFRPAVYRAAIRSGASGKVWNDGSGVTIYTDNGNGILKELLLNLPPLAKIKSIKKIECKYNGPKGFKIDISNGNGSGASIPTDTALCNECTSEIFSNGRRSRYAFTTCTNCGPRFTILKNMPYDRASTSMDVFKPCQKCNSEFLDPVDRRFHHQTLCCPKCGPKYRLLDGRGIEIPGEPIINLTKMLDDGCIAIIKGWGGMHICCNLEQINRMRKWYGRKEKPFAIMVKDMNSIMEYATPTYEEKKVLTSSFRPIVLVRKVYSEITELVSPGLDNIGIFLPYAGVHHILFSGMKHNALIMTSANIPGEPMIIDDTKLMNIKVDAYLIHDQPIVNRADDSVIRMFGDRTQFIRRSRGKIPFSIDIPIYGDSVGIGPQESVTGSIASKGHIWLTQYIGNSKNFGVVEYLSEAIKTQISLINCKPQIVAMDLHPRYSNIKFGKLLAEEFNADTIKVQHHWAHAISLMVDNKIDKCIVLTLDGTGYGDDGMAWGGEVLDQDINGYRRVSHLEYIPLIGSEKAIHNPKRLKFAIDYINGIENHDFTDENATVMLKIANKSVKTSSFGRILDALSCSLGVCDKCTYSGEPAMKLEPLLQRGKLIDGFNTQTVGDTIMTANLFSRITIDKNKADVAYSIVYNIMKELIDSAICAQDKIGTRHIGITGGVSYSGPISKIFRDIVLSYGYIPIMHRDVPNGDGGISVGQAAIALQRLQ